MVDIRRKLVKNCDHWRKNTHKNIGQINNLYKVLNDVFKHARTLPGECGGAGVVVHYFIDLLLQQLLQNKTLNSNSKITLTRTFV